MQDEQRNAAYLWDILQASQEIASFVEGMKFHEFENDKMVRYAVERQLLVIGEAANHLTESFRKIQPLIPAPPQDE
jgi:uncharacterized protein with HEPN domain